MALPVLAFGTASPTRAMASASMMAAPKPMRCPGGDQQPERRRDAAEERRNREDDDTGDQEPAAADDVTEPPDADDQGGDGEQIGKDNPLHFLEGGVERHRQCRQANIGDARAERGQ